MCRMVRITCPYQEYDGRLYVATSLRAYRRHLTVHHGMEYDAVRGRVFALSPAALEARLRVIRRGQGHGQRPTDRAPWRLVPPVIVRPPQPPPDRIHVRRVTSSSSESGARPQTQWNVRPTTVAPPIDVPPFDNLIRGETVACADPPDRSVNPPSVEQSGAFAIQMQGEAVYSDPLFLPLSVAPYGAGGGVPASASQPVNFKVSSASVSMSDCGPAQDTSVDWDSHDDWCLPCELWPADEFHLIQTPPHTVMPVSETVGVDPVITSTTALDLSSVTAPGLVVSPTTETVGVNPAVDGQVTETPTIPDHQAFHAWLQQWGLADPTPPAARATTLEPDRVHHVGVQTTDPRIIAPGEFITYRQSFSTFRAATFIGTILTSSTSLDAVAIADRAAAWLGLARDDQPAWDAIYRMAVMAVVAERHLRLRLGEMMAVTARIDPSGALSIAGVLNELALRQSRPWDMSDLPESGDAPGRLAIDDVVEISSDTD